MLDLVIRGARVIDGSGQPGRTADIAVVGDRIAAVAGARVPGRARRVIDADGLVAAPGFVDLHSHSDYHLLLAPSADSSLRQGVTLEIGGNCGYSAAPIWGDWAADQATEYASRYGLQCGWYSFAEYTTTLAAARPAINYGHLVGHNTLRGSATSGRAGPVAPTEQATMVDGLRQAMRQGALGLSTGLAYSPACHAEAGELVALARAAREEGGILSAHVRSEGDGLLEAVAEILGVAREAGVALQISHLKTMYEANWGKIDRALELIEGARAGGQDVSADRYPYTAAATGLEALLPSWALEGTRRDRLARLASTEARARMLGELCKRPESIWRQVAIADTPRDGGRPGQTVTIAEAARAAGKSPEELVLDRLAEADGQVGAIFHAMSEANLHRILTREWVMVGSDSGCRAPGDALGGHPHPRTFGTFVRVLGPLVRDAKWFPLEAAVRKMTGDPCRRVGLVDRGRVAPGCYADVVLFDATRVGDRATYEAPWAFPDGVHAVLVNGQLALDEGSPTGLRAGRVVHRHARARGDHGTGVEPAGSIAGRRPAG